MNGLTAYITWPMFDKITSIQNPRVKLTRALRDKKDREREQRFVIDDGRDLERALACGYTVDFALYCPELSEGRFAYAVPSARVFEVPRSVMEKAAYRENPSDVLAVMESHPVKGHAALDATLQTAGAVLVLVNLQKPGNLGALMRTADASGFKALVWVDTSLDVYNPNIIRSSTGTCFLDNVYSLKTTEALDVFKRHNYWMTAAHLQGSVSLYEAKFPHKTAIVLGTEDVGLPKLWADACDERVYIPMVGQVSDSLNVSVSGAVMMYEVFRQHLLLG